MKHLRKDWLKWVAACFALVATASAEYELARAIGMDRWVAMAVPGALDAYVLRALRAHREVLTAVLAMVGVNAASHLLTAGHLYLDWPLITAVSAIAPLVLWRVHALGTPGEARLRALWGPSTDEPASTETFEEPASTQTCPNCGHDEHGYLAHMHAENGYEHGEHSVLRDCSVCPCAQELRALCGGCSDTDTFEEHASTALGVLDYVPREWSTDQEKISSQTAAWEGDWVTPPVPEHAPDDPPVLCSVCSEPVTFTDEHGWRHAPGAPWCVLQDVPRWEHDPEKRDLGARMLKAVPDLPDGYEHAGLKPGDDAYLSQARVLHARGTALRNWKTTLGVGTARAQRLRDHIESEHTSTEEST